MTAFLLSHHYFAARPPVFFATPWIFLLVTLRTSMLHLLVLNETNHVAIRGPISEKSVSPILHAAMTAATPPQYLFLDTGGGDVMAGQRLIQLVVALQLTCVAFRAYSMGFAILQHCVHRLILPGATLMQHQMSFKLNGEFSKVQGYLDMAQQLGHAMQQVQARRLGVSVEWFRNRTQGEWWMAESMILHQRCADAVVHATCSSDLARRSVMLSHPERIYAAFSACPLISQPLPNSTS